MQKNMQRLNLQCNKSKRILSDLKALREKATFDEEDLCRLVELKEELSRLSPPERFIFIEGRMVIDLWAELLKIEKEI